MLSNPTPSMANGASVVAEKPVGGTIPNKKNLGRVPKKIHKAEREKLKRDHLNELFLVLGHALEPAQQNSGKASVLGDATRILRDLIAQVESLRKENSALVTESHYVTEERNELRDENTVLEAGVSRLQKELQERVHSDPLWCNGTDTTPLTDPQLTSTALPMQQQPSVGPIYVIPLHQDLQHYPEVGLSPASATPSLKPPPCVRKPQPRYPTPSDSWPLEILSRQPTQSSEGSSSSSMLDGGEEGSDKLRTPGHPIVEEIGVGEMQR